MIRLSFHVKFVNSIFFNITVTLIKVSLFVSMFLVEKIFQVHFKLSFYGILMAVIHEIEELRVKRVIAIKCKCRPTASYPFKRSLDL